MSAAERWALCRQAPAYEVSDIGQVRRIGGKVLAQFIPRNGYPTVSTWLNNRRKNFSVHRLVAEAFCVRARPEQTWVNHLSGDRKDCRASNLEWCTCRENALHAVRVMKTMKPPVWRGVSNPQHRPVVRIDVNGGEERHFATMTLAAAQGFDIRGIYAVCSGEQKTHYGYRWRYASAARTKSHNKTAPAASSHGAAKPAWKRGRSA